MEKLMALYNISSPSGKEGNPDQEDFT